MTKVQKPSSVRAGIAAAAMALFSTSFTFAQQATKPAKPKREHIQATAQGTGTQVGRMITIQITIEEY